MLHCLLPNDTQNNGFVCMYVCLYSWAFLPGCVPCAHSPISPSTKAHCFVEHTNLLHSSVYPIPALAININILN